MQKFFFFWLSGVCVLSAYAQIDTSAVKVRGKMLRNKVHHVGEISLANYQVNDKGDTILLNRLQPVEVWTLRSYSDPKLQEAYERTVAGVRRVWTRVRQADSLWQSIRSQSARNKELENTLRQQLESDLRAMSRFEGALFLKLLSRFTGLTAYDLIRNLRGAFAAAVYQKAARKADLDLKMPFNPQANDYDRRLDEVCHLLENGTLTPLP